MKNKLKHLLVLIILVVVFVIMYRYDQYIIKKNFILEVSISCDSSKETCFVMDCSVDIDPDCDKNPYKKIKISATYAPICLEEHTCDDFTCDNLNDCSTLICSDDNKESWETCLTNYGDNTGSSTKK
jgi:hypothetical protein